MNQDAVITYCDGYNFEMLQPWAHSLVKSGFSGHKIVMAGNMKSYNATRLSDLGFSVIGFKRDEYGNLVLDHPRAAVVFRYLALYTVLLTDARFNANRLENVLFTDAKDVVFQKNPSEYMAKVLNDRGSTTKLIVGSESVTYEDEPWGKDNIIRSFPEPPIHQPLLPKLIGNCGTWAGKADHVRDMAMQIYLISKGSSVPNPDQAAFNILLNSKPWCDIVALQSVENGWCAQCGTTNDPTKPDLKQKSKDRVPYMPVPDGEVLNPYNEQPMTMVHQYDRVPEWRDLIKARYEKI